MGQSICSYYWGPRLLAHPPLLRKPILKIHPNSRNTGGLQNNTSEPIEKVRDVLRCELSSNLELDHPEFDATYLAILQVVDAANCGLREVSWGRGPLVCTTGLETDGLVGKNVTKKAFSSRWRNAVSTFMKFLDEAGIESPSQRPTVCATTQHPHLWEPKLFYYR